MNTDSHNLQDPTNPKPDPHPYHEGVTSPMSAPKKQLIAYRDGRSLVLVNGAEIASHICLKSGHPVHTHIKTAIRSPFNPATWFRATDSAIIGLSHSELKKYNKSFLIARGLIGLGVILFAAGFSYGAAFVVAGLALATCGLVIRAMCPIWSPDSSNSGWMKIYGCGEHFLDLFPEKRKLRR